MDNVAIKGSDLTIMYAMRDGLRQIKKEMDERGLTFDEFLALYDCAIKELEAQANSCRT